MCIALDVMDVGTKCSLRYKKHEFTIIQLEHLFCIIQI